MTADERTIETVARKLAGQYMIDDGYGEDSRKSAEAGEMWRNFRGAARVAITALEGDAAMRAFSASDAACYLWPEDTDEHKALRAAYIKGAASTALKSDDEGYEHCRMMLGETLADLEYWYKRAAPDWDGKASSTSVIGRARALTTRGEVTCSNIQSAARASRSTR